MNPDQSSRNTTHKESTFLPNVRFPIASFPKVHIIRIDLPPTLITSDGDWDIAGPEFARILDVILPPWDKQPSPDTNCLPANANTVDDVNIHHLEINGITWLDHNVMVTLSTRQPLKYMKTLTFKQPLVWCGVCNAIDAPGFKYEFSQLERQHGSKSGKEKGPVTGRGLKIVYEDGTGLPVCLSSHSRYII
jgi:hypothetical protein